MSHFFEKGLLLLGALNKSTAKRKAAERQEYMLQFLKQFYKEWNLTIEPEPRD